ncbi:PH domain-containing protein [Agromyces silvae]|uniref:PH domain-containing protein n=1 Tax=Agromyces silvae TaxID=3388266 RepID=UPI00280C31F1|nr:PH domain-containing protein [Agromyces protaetiae]
MSRRPEPEASDPRASAPGLSVPTAMPAAPERVVARFRRHARVLILPVLLLIAVAGGAVYALLTLTEVWQLVAVGAGAVLVVLLGTLLPFFAWLTRRWTLTTRRIIQRSGVFARSRQELQLHRAHEVSVRRTPGQRMFGAGDVRITTAHERPLVLHDVPAPLAVQAALDELIDRSHRDAVAVRRNDPPDPDLETVIWGTR